LDLSSEGLIPDAGFTVKSRWLRPGGGPVLSRRVGAFIEYDGGLRRIPQPIYGIAQTAEALSRPTAESERYAALAALQRDLPEGAGEALQANGYIADTRIQYASAFSLKLGGTDPFDFDPVLFGQATRNDAAEGAPIDEEADSILAPRAQRIFAQERFRRSPDVKAAYVLRDGEYVYIDPALRPVLGEIRRLQQAPLAERRAFVLNPRRLLRQRLGDERSEAVGIEKLFVETEQYSARVTGVDVWTKPVLPWLKPVPGTWLPESFGVKIGDAFVTLPPEAVEPLVAAVEAAMERGDPSVSADGVELPATRQTVEALRSLANVARGGDTDRGETQTGESGQKKPGQSLFLVVRQNFEEVEFAPVGRHSTTPAPAFTAPARVRSTLKPHQVEGVKWLINAASSGRLGVLLADDMGLGKTLQAITFMAWLQAESAFGRRRAGPFLVVAPTGLLSNWRREIETHLHSPFLGNLVLAFGANLKALREEEGFTERDIHLGRASLDAENWRSAGVVLTTYETMRDYHFSFAKSHFGLIVFDEAQKLKNPASQLTRASRTLNADFVLGMTGTPVENRLQDMWSIMDGLSPGLLGSSKDFERRYPAHDHAALRGLHALLTAPADGSPAHMLRRLKDDGHLPGLPTKHEHFRKLPMPPVQALAYKAVVDRAVGGRQGLSKWDGMLQVLHNLRDISLHPIRPEDAPDDLERYGDDSARLKWTLEILAEVAQKREKVLIFVESLAMQARLAAMIQARFKLPQPPPRIHGGVPGAKRQAIVDAFQRAAKTFDVMLLSPKAGGVGLTITAANHVIHLSRWWNPAVEDQCTDRVFRIGQTRDVHVYLPLAVHPDPFIGPASFDLQLHDLLAKKRSLARHMLVPPDGGESDIDALFDGVTGFDGQSVSGGSAEIPVTKAVATATASVPDGMPNRQTTEARPQPTAPNRASTRPRAGPWRLQSGQRRPVDEIVSLFAGKTVSDVAITDPYALAGPKERSAQVQFIRRLRIVAQNVKRVTIVYRPPRDDETETESAQRSGMQLLWRTTLGDDAARISLTMTARQKRHGQDFHDRSVVIICAEPDGQKRTHELISGRGLLGLMDEKWECTITYTPPQDA
jgi:hypothetical protein